MASKNQVQGKNRGQGRSGKENRGFASMSEEAQRKIARMGGEAVSENRQHMAEIGRKGGEASAESRAASSHERSGGKASSSERADEQSRAGFSPARSELGELGGAGVQGSSSRSRSPEARSPGDSGASHR